MTETLKSGGDQDGPSALMPSERFEILSLRRRRTILRCLAEQPNGTIDFRGLVEAVSTHEAETEVEEPAIEDRARAPRRQRVARALHHDDLPRLAEAGLIEYDRWYGEIRYNRDDRLDDWLARTVEDEHAQHDNHDREPYSTKP
jgi:DNA-binding transcriptional ArsR family regulator